MTLERTKTRVVGVDISSERTTYAIVDVRGNIIADDHFETSDFSDVNDFATTLAERIVMLVEANGGYETIRSVGVSAPSASFKLGSIVNAANLPWKGFIPLSAMLRDRLGLAVAVANDAHVSALGEKTYGCAHGMKDFIVINIGVGLGSCFFTGGHEHLGEEGFAGEIGHCCVVPVNGRICGCGKAGCLETYTAANGIVKTAEEMMTANDVPSLMRQLEKLSPRTIKECCDQGDELAIEVYRHTGNISKAGHWLFDPAQKSFEENVFHNMRGKVKFIVSELDDRVRDVLGASALAWVVPEYSLFK